MTIRHFRIFIAVASTESITRAAEKLFLTQPTVSVAIREMEEHYGTRFFERINQRLKITEDGRALLGFATHLISLYDEIETTFRNPDAKGLLRVGASINAGAYFLPSLVREFQEKYPQFQIRAQIAATEVIEKRVLDNQLDLAIVGGAVHSPFLERIPLFSERYTAVCASSDPLAGKTVTLREFAAMPLLFRERGSGACEVFQAAVAQAGCSVEPAWESASETALLEAARCGLGVTILPEKIAAAELKKQGLAKITLSDFSFENTVCLIYHKQKYRSPAMQHWIALAESRRG